MFGTESCLPIYGLQDAGKILFKNDTSWLNARHRGEVREKERSLQSLPFLILFFFFVFIIIYCLSFLWLIISTLFPSFFWPIVSSSKSFPFVPLFDHFFFYILSFHFLSLFDHLYPCKSTWETAACFLSVDPQTIPQRAVWKTLPGWIMLTRRHAHEVKSRI